ncbi:hypothetical protein NE237_001141 [Protea cynaroides]|uniref:Uncharacterized protein n=1 Tax=Protea cynaroides TaxID=273540 RepID=A0A9Q0QY73_9MAGN|nr:hypothetical protein NE237_001141 [Protea cynaroides]
MIYRLVMIPRYNRNEKPYRNMRPPAFGAGVIGGGRGYGRGSGVNPNAMVLWDREVFLHSTRGISENASSKSRSAYQTMGHQSTATTFALTGRVSEQAGVVFSARSNGRLRNQSRPDEDHHVRFENVYLQDGVADGVVQSSRSEMHRGNYVPVMGRVSQNQGDGISAAISMVNAGNRVSAGIQRHFDDPMRMADAAGTENLPFGVLDPSSHVGNSSGAGVNLISGPLAVSEPVTEMDHQVAFATDGVTSAVLERTHLDIGRFLGFPSKETGVSPVGNNLGDDSVPTVTVTQAAPAGMTRHVRKRRKWVAREKGKNVSVLGEGLHLMVNRSAPISQSVVHGQRAHAGGSSFVDVLSGLPDLSSLPEPVNEGGIIRVVIPQEA